MGTGNQAINLVVALFAVITTGGVVLTAQLTGRKRHSARVARGGATRFCSRPRPRW